MTSYGSGLFPHYAALLEASAIPPGVVVRQTPAGGYQVHPGDAISLEVSR